MKDAVVRPAGPAGGLLGIGNLWSFQQDTLGFLTGAAGRYGDVVYFRMMAFHFYMLNHPDMVYEALIGQGAKLEKWKRQTDTWANAVGASTLTMEGEPWKRHRKLLNPSFHAPVVKRYLQIVIEHTDRLLDRWDDGQTYEMMFEMMRTTMGIIADIIFSVKDIESEAAELNRALTAVFEVLTARTTAFQQTPLWLPTSENRRIAAATKVIETFILDMIRKRRAEGKDHGDVLSDLIAAEDENGDRLSDLEICYELKTLFGAGHETTALWMMWTLHILSQRPDVQEALFAEAQTALQGGSPALESLKSLPYTDMVLNESMRLYPPAWSLMVRRAKEPLQLGEVVIPKDSVLLIPMWVVHRDGRIFPDPLCFDPQRFAGDWKSRYPKYAYFPFGGGPHVCLGSHLAMFEGQVILPMLVQRFTYEAVPQPDLTLQALLTLRPKNGLKIKVHRRS